MKRAALSQMTGSQTPIAGGTTRAAKKQSIMDEIAAADLPKLNPKEPPHGDMLKVIKKSYLIPAILSILFFIAGIAVFFIANSQVKDLEKPVQYEVAADSVYLSSSKSITKFDQMGKKLWTKKDANGYSMNGDLVFDWGNDGNIYLANPLDGTIEVFNTESRWVNKIAKSRLSSNFTLSTAPGNAVVFIADAGRNKIDIYDFSNNRIASVGEPGSGPKGLRSPGGITVLPDRTVVVADTFNVRFQRLDREYNLIEPWYIPMKAVIPGSDRDDPVKVKYKGQENTLGVKYFPGRMVTDTKRSRFYVVFSTVSGERDAYIGIFDFNGNFIENKVLKTIRGQAIVPDSLRMMNDGMVSIVETDRYFAGEWDPDSGSTTPASYVDLKKTLAGLEQAAVLNGKLNGLSRFLLLIGLLGATLLVTLINRKQREDWLGPDPSARYTRRRTQTFSTEKVFQIPGPENDDQHSRWRSTLADTLTIVVIPIVAAIYMVLRHFTAPNDEAVPNMVYIRPAILVTLIWAGMILVVLFHKKLSVNGYMETKLLRRRDQLIRVLGPELSGLMVKGERLMDALMVIMPNRRVGLMLLTDRRVIWADSAGKGGLFVGRPQLWAVRLRDFTGAQLYAAFFKPLWNLEFQTAGGSKITVQTAHYWGARALMKRMEWLLRRIAAQPKPKDQKPPRPLCPNCFQPVEPDDKRCPHCKIKFKNPFIAAFLSLLVSGAGQFYNKQSTYGISYISPFIVLAAISAMHFGGVSFNDIGWVYAAAAAYSFFWVKSIFRAFTDGKYLSGP